MISEANQLGLNIPYPYDIDWLPDEGKPLGLFALAGWIDKKTEEIKQMRAEDERKAKGLTENHYSEISESEGGD